ncbi:MAG: gfo/Idh/MocA family oxidoreductase [Balneolaceae bacterium]|nr:MAG: gfo/Idh/MocA family oxidoreductase [Balneolaceae bacterium]
MQGKSPKYKLGIVGCGSISRIHAHAIRSNERAVLASAHSRTEDSRNAFCEEFAITGFSGYSDFLASDVDIVVLCTPNGTHLDYGMQAADAGKHLIIEKPLEVTVERGKQLVDHCKLRGVKLAVIYQNRFIDNVRKMKQALDDGAIGKVVMVRASIKWFRDQDYYKSRPWRGSLSLDGGGALINQSIHTVDLMLWLAGPVASVQAYKGTLTHDGMEGEDNFVASMQFKSGALGVLEASTSIVPSQNRVIEIHGTGGTAILNGDNLRILESGDSVSSDGAGNTDDAPASGGSSGPLAGFSNSHHTEQYRQIFLHLDAGLQPPVSGHESLKSLAFVQAAYRSAEQQAAVSPDRFFPYTSLEGE